MFYFYKIAQFHQNLDEKREPATYISMAAVEAHGKVKVDVY